ncbi:MAG: twin-arginine translocase TatA/TatE family subunit [Planctomycetota bacterium]|jgi:sec-independent protein translocase protein TatA
MPRICKLLLPLALFLGLPFLLDERVQPSGGGGGGAGPAAAAERTAVVGYRYTHYDPVSGALVFELHGDRAVKQPAPAGSPQDRFALEGLRVRLAEQAGRAAAFTPMELTAPGGAFRHGEGGDTLVNLDGGVRAACADGTTFATTQVRVTVGEKSGILTEARAPGAIQVRGPGLELDAAGGRFSEAGGWVLDGPCTGSVTQRDTGDPGATAELQRSVLGLHAPQGLILMPAAEGGGYVLTADGGLFLVRRAQAAAPVQTIFGGDAAEIHLAGGAVRAVRVRNNLRAASLEPDGRCSAVVAAAAGAWDPIDRTLTLTGRPRWYLRSGAAVWVPGEPSPDPLPAQPLAPAEAAGGWMASAQRSMSARRDLNAGTVELGLRERAEVAAVQLTPGHPATRALAPIPAEALRNPLAIAAYLANRNLQDTAGEADGRVQAERIDALAHPRRGDLQVIDFDAQDRVVVRGGGAQALRALAQRARGRFTSERTVRSLAAQLTGGPQAETRPEAGRTVRIVPDGRDAELALESVQAGSQRTVTVTGTNGVKLLDLRNGSPVADWRADTATVELKRGEGIDEVVSLSASGDVRASAPTRGGGGGDGERALVALEELQVVRTLGLRGEGREVWRWAGAKNAMAPAAATFDTVKQRKPLPGEPGSRWSLFAPAGTMERRLKQAGKRWVPVSTSVVLQGPSTAALKSATEASTADAFELRARDGATLSFSHDASPGGQRLQSELNAVEFPNGGTYRSAAMQVTAARAEMTQAAGERVWVFEGSPVTARFRAGRTVPLTTTQVPGGQTPGASSPWFDARAERIEVKQSFADDKNAAPTKQHVVLSGSPVIGQLPAGAEGGAAWPVPEWELRSGDPIHLEVEGSRSVLRGSGGVVLTNYDQEGNRQGRVRASGVVVESAADGGSTARFSAPFVAEGVTAPEAFAGLGEAGGGEPVRADRVRLIATGPVTLTRAAGSNEVEIRSKTLNILPLDSAGAPIRAVRVPEGIRVIPAADGAWTFAFLGENAAAVPLESSELDELAKLARGLSILAMPAGVSVAFIGGLGVGEMVLIAIVALLVFGRDLPEVARKVGKGVSEFKRGVGGVEEEIRSAVYDPVPGPTPEAAPPVTPTTAPPAPDAQVRPSPPQAPSSP